MIDRDYTEAVDRGAKLLDERFPEWYKSINLAKLDMGSVRSCVLGQLVWPRGGSYDEAILDLDIDPVEFGFDIAESGSPFEENWNELWVEAVVERWPGGIHHRP